MPDNTVIDLRVQEDHEYTLVIQTTDGKLNNAYEVNGKNITFEEQANQCCLW
ncbi:hypothetical protein [Alteromonas sp. AMM-1]|uniref:hypothetical protein n=1 Tax=Alteromonas sp. AMM-1 TaxID=3394233 RepID=UPI0039A6F655